jgi:mannose-6-phosphate isomerase-like protein (cupin superfamily)
MITEKNWGTTEALLRTPLIEVHRIAVRPFACCSWHKHERKWNAFFVADGALRIEIDELPRLTMTPLRSHGFLAVGPGVWHRFTTGGEPAVAIELYYPDCLSEDIIRRDVGGMLGGAVAAVKPDQPLPLEQVA